MKDSRKGETLWSEWTGNDYNSANATSLVFYTEEHVDIDHEVVRRALASAIQRDGCVDTLGESFKLIDSCTFTHGFAGVVDGEPEFTLCDKDGMTIYEDLVEKVIPVTWVNIDVG
jgi:hypothetical protein